MIIRNFEKIFWNNINSKKSFFFLFFSPASSNADDVSIMVTVISRFLSVFLYLFCSQRVRRTHKATLRME